MSLSPTKHRTLSRQPSSPSLAVGLPPALPESDIMKPSSSSQAKAARAKSRKRIHRGDVSSSAASSDNEDPPTEEQVTPKRRVVNAVEVPVSAGKRTKKMTLQERLAAAASANASAKSTTSGTGGIKAKVKSSRSIAEMSMATSASEQSTATLVGSSSSIMSPQTIGSEITSSSSRAGMNVSSSDKVVVCMRIKPTQSPFASMAYEISPTSLSLSDDHPKVKQRGGKAGREDGYTYTFDKLLRHPSTTPELYFDKVAPLVEKAMNGFNSTIFAYGQTGSGKSFTMTGIPEELGIIPCAVDGVFDAITADPERAFLLRVSYIEIYNETLRDLLNFKKGPLKDDEKPAIHYAKGKVYVDPLVEEIVSTPQDVIELLEKGNAGRRIGATDWNERSSRSHCVFTIVVESRPRDGDGDGDIRLSRLNLIDLAGSEKAVSDSERRGEGKHINQSLLALREVINKLTEKAKATHIPYRNSKLTYLLENALGGDSNICVICTMSAEEEHYAETLETLKFAGRCSQVKTNAKKNVLLSSERALIKAKDMEIEELRNRLEGLTGSQSAQFMEPEVDHVSNLAESVAAMEARKARLKAQLAKLNGEILTSELPRSSSGLPLSPPKPKRRRISDFSAMVTTGPGRMGLGLGTPKKTVDRRAISGMSRLPEEGEEMAGIMGTLEQVAEGSVAKSFDQDRALAAVRRSLAAKEEELSLANRNLASALSRASQLSDRDTKISALQVELKDALESFASLQNERQRTESSLRDENAGLEAKLARIEADLKDQNAQLEGTRADLVATIEDKAKKIDALENKVLDLRKSREELVMEDQSRLDEVQKRADEVERERDEISARLVQAIEAEQKKAEEVAKMREELDAALATQQAELAISSTRAEEHEKVVNALQAQMDELNASKQSQVTALQSEKAAVERQRDEARSDLDRFQREAMQNEAGILAELRGEIGNLRKAREEDKIAWDKERAELEAARAATRTAEERAAKQDAQLSDALDTLQKAAEANAVLEANLRAEQDTNAAIVAGRSDAETRAADALMKLEEADRANGALEERLRAEEQSKVSLINERDEARGRLATADGAAQQLDAEISARTRAEEKVMDLQSRLEAEMAKTNDVQKRLCSAQEDMEVQEKRLESESTSRQDAETRLNDLTATHDHTLATLREKDDVLEVERKAREDAERRVAELAGQREANLVGVKEMRKRLDAEVVARKEAEEQVASLKTRQEANIDAVKEMRRKVDAEVALKKAVEAELVSLKRQQAANADGAKEIKEKIDDEIAARKKVEDELVSLKARQEAASAGEAELQARLDSKSKAFGDAEKRIASLIEEKDGLALELDKANRSVDELRAAQDDILSRLADASSSSRVSEEAHTAEILAIQIAARKAAEEHLVNVTQELVGKHESAQRVLEDELLSLRKTLSETKAELDGVRADAETLREQAAKLTSELVELRTKNDVTITTSISSRLRQSAPGPGVGIDKDMSSTVKEGLRRRARRGYSTGTSGGLDRDNSLVLLSQREDDEIDRLEKVIEAQKEIIDDQREKIERWAREMDKQREIVRLLTLTADTSSSSTLTRPSPPRAHRHGHGHGKSHSISHSPAAAPAGPAKGLVPSFTARNLALPTSPSPLPMHPSQFSNAASRKSRRVTIEHDMDRLTESSKVLRAKAIFESPEKGGSPGPGTGTAKTVPSTPPRAPLRATQAVRSVPRQRRP